MPIPISPDPSKMIVVGSGTALRLALKLVAPAYWWVTSPKIVKEKGAVALTCPPIVSLKAEPYAPPINGPNDPSEVAVPKILFEPSK